MKRAMPQNHAVLDRIRSYIPVIMKEKNLNPARLAALATIPLSTITRLLDGTIKNSSIDVALSLAQALNIPVSELSGETMGHDGTISITIEALDRPRLLSNICEAISQQERLITSLAANTTTQAGQKIFRCTAQCSVEGLEELANMIGQLGTILGCRKVKILGQNIDEDEILTQVNDYIAQAIRVWQAEYKESLEVREVRRHLNQSRQPWALEFVPLLKAAALKAPTLHELSEQKSILQPGGWSPVR